MTNPDNRKYLRVIDSSCTPEAQERTHSVNFGGEKVSVTFKYGEPTVLPYELAMKFNVEGFTLESTDGAPLVLPTQAKDAVALHLEADECVAKYYELTTESLVLRAVQKPNGEIFGDAGEEDRSDLVAFLSGKGPDGTGEAGDDQSEIDDEDSLIEEDDDETNGGAGLSDDAPAPVNDPAAPQEIDQSGEGSSASAEEVEAVKEYITQHFAAGRENVAFRDLYANDQNEVVVFGVVEINEDGSETELAVGSLLELHEAALQGLTAEQYMASKPAPAAQGGEEATA